MRALVLIALMSGIMMTSCGGSMKTETQPVGDSIVIDSVAADSCDSINA